LVRAEEGKEKQTRMMEEKRGNSFTRLTFTKKTNRKIRRKGKAPENDHHKPFSLPERGSS